MALLIDQSVNYAQIENLAKNAERKILQEVNLFDVYKGKGVEEGKKSYGVSFIFRDDSKTLTDKQVDQVMDRLLAEFKKELGAGLR
jgi:phenylalanyl-tRNA synthetase beta chain